MHYSSFWKGNISFWTNVMAGVVKLVLSPLNKKAMYFMIFFVWLKQVVYNSNSFWRIKIGFRCFTGAFSQAVTLNLMWKDKRLSGLIPSVLYKKILNQTGIWFGGRETKKISETSHIKLGDTPISKRSQKILTLWLPLLRFTNTYWNYNTSELYEID